MLSVAMRGVADVSCIAYFSYSADRYVGSFCHQQQLLQNLLIHKTRAHTSGKHAFMQRIVTKCKIKNHLNHDTRPELKQLVD